MNLKFIIFHEKVKVNLNKKLKSTKINFVKQYSKSAARKLNVVKNKTPRHKSHGTFRFIYLVRKKKS
jgi:hypothetical protein